MFGTFRTLITGASVRAEERVRDAYAIELIEQKIREVEASVKAAKTTLASLIQRKRSEERHVETLKTRIKSMTARAAEALEAGNDDLAGEAAEAIATMENELQLRGDTLARLGKHKTGVSCLYINKLDDIDLDVLTKLIQTGLADLDKIWPVHPN
mgnify:CR=1 FL=1